MRPTPNDYETMKLMLTRAGVVFEETISHNEETEGRAGLRQIEIVAGAGPMNRGYQYFLTTFTFDACGELRDVGAWE